MSCSMAYLTRKTSRATPTGYAVPHSNIQLHGRSQNRPARRNAWRELFRLPCQRHTSGATHLVGDIRPQNRRRRLDTVSLRGVNVQRLFGSQRAMKTIEDFTQFEQRAAYFDGDILSAAAKGINPLDRGSQVHFIAELQNLLDFPPAPGLSWDGKLDASKFPRCFAGNERSAIVSLAKHVVVNATQHRFTRTTKCTT